MTRSARRAIHFIGRGATATSAWNLLNNSIPSAATIWDVFSVEWHDVSGHPRAVVSTGNILGLPSTALHLGRVETEGETRQLHFLGGRRADRATLTKDALRNDAVQIRLALLRVQFSSRNELLGELVVDDRNQKERRAFGSEEHRRSNA